MAILTHKQQIEAARKRIKRFQATSLAEAHKEMNWLLDELDLTRAALARLVSVCPKGLIEVQDANRILE